MKDFARLITRLDQTTKTLVKIEALVQYFEIAQDQDRLWAIGILSHRRPKRTVKTALLREAAADMGQVPLWLFEESYHIVGDLSETIALILPPPEKEEEHSLSYWVEYLKGLKAYEDHEKKHRIQFAWSQLDAMERFIFNKLITGGFRIGVSQKLMVRALSQYTGIEENILAHRLMGKWRPDTTTYADLVLKEDPKDDISRPYPFYLAYALDQDPEELGDPGDWQAERKWDGIRGQVIVREGEVFVWSRGEELVTDKFPEYGVLAEYLPDGTVIDGEILPWKEGSPLPFNVLQTRIGRKNVSKNILKKAPVILMAYDLLEWGGEDIRAWSMQQRRQQLEQAVAANEALEVLQLSPIVNFDTWDKLAEERAQSREHLSEGIMLKHKAGEYKTGRKRGEWWKWKVDPLIIDGVMLYAQRGHGRRANLYTDYTFAVWDGDQLVPFAKAYSGLTDAEIQEVDRFVKKNTLERFGPVRSVTPDLVFEIAFEGIQFSKRHKSGVALRFPRISRWRRDKPASEANTLGELKSLLQ